MCFLTGEKGLIQRVPDASFGLATFSDIEYGLECRDELRKTGLQKLLLHPKYGLLADPKWGETDLVFPFMVYEAKGWSGDYREARFQACLAGATYLDMLDNLARTPGPLNAPRPYQTPSSHGYQVFVLTSFGAHWHLLVGYRRPRDKEECAGHKGVSDDVYVGYCSPVHAFLNANSGPQMFHRIWDARVVNELHAWQLLVLIDQIHLWATTQHRTFVLKHLRAWHKLCVENQLLNWKSCYDLGPGHKRKRAVSDDGDYALPHWATLLDEASKRKALVKARDSVDQAQREQADFKGKYPEVFEAADGSTHCQLGRCKQRSPGFETSERWLLHIRDNHTNDMNEWELASLRRYLCNLDSQIERLSRLSEREHREVTNKRKRLSLSPEPEEPGPGQTPDGVPFFWTRS